MKHLSSEQNKSVQAINRKDWPAVRNILENEPHFIETVDEDGYTPLMYAVGHNAPDDVLENMIETATVENLEHQTPAGRTILHYLVDYAARVSALRRVLKRTNTKINMQDNRGYTPLHYCLSDREPTHSYEDHKEEAIVLITYGASASIKDLLGKTPLDFYDENKCEGYEETMRSEKKQDLRELLERLSPPSEILARGPDAAKAFKDALKNGEITVVNSRLIFLGQEGSGKTSCVKAMLGKEFNKDEPSTDGIVRTTVFQTVGEDHSKWEEQKDVDECEQTKQILEHSIAVDVAKKMEQPKSEQNKYKNSSDLAVKSSPGSVVSKSTAEVEQPEAEISKGKPVSEDTTGVSTNQLILRKKVFETMINKSSGTTDLTCILDYAGQLDYYITHRFFFTDRTSYAVVFSLLDALDKSAKSRDPKKGFLEMTNLQSILFWIRSIFEHAVLLHGSQSKNVINGRITSPPISLIGTHADLLTGTDAEKQKKVDDIFDSIFEAIKGEPYECHVDRERYAVDNTTAMDKGIQRLKRNVGGYMKTMARTVPIKWVEFQIMLQEAGKTTLRMSLEKIIKIAVECSIKEENVIHVLNYFTDIGIILYSPTNEKLKNTVITNIHMLIRIFMKIITVVKLGDSVKAPVMIRHWHKLDNEGILAEPLARYLWRNELKSIANEDGDDEVIFEDFIELMKKFGLLLEKNASVDGTRLYIVPSRMKTKTDNRLDIKKDDEQTVSIYVTPKDFLPDAVYNVLVVRFVNLSQDKGCGAIPKLFQNQSTIGFGNKHYLRLGRISIDSKPSLKLEISRMIETNADGTDKPACKPHPDVCNEVLNVLKQNLNEVYPSKQDVGYLLKILCPCSLEHFQELDDCLDNEYIDCDKTGAYKAIPTANIQKLFLADLSFRKEIRNSYALQALTIDLGTEQMRKYFMRKGKLRDKHEVGKFLSRQRKIGPLNGEDFGDEASKIFIDDVDIDSFDITILMCLIQHCFSPKGDKFWKNPPDIQDKSELANLRRIQLYKESTLDCSHSNSVTNVEFDRQWKELATIFRDIGVPDDDIQKYHKLSIGRPVRGFEQKNIEEIRNFQVILSAVVDVGTVTMREYFLDVANQDETKQNKPTKLDKKDVGRYLMNEKRKGSFKNVKITTEQNAKMFTPTADIDTFDISIMYLIIRNCCSIPYSFWNNPDIDIVYRLPSLVHIHRYRNTKLAHAANSRMSNKEFEIEWKEVRSMLHAAGASFNDIDRYKWLRFIN